MQINQMKATCKITLRGHADYNPGNDIVCAALSNTAYMLLNYLLRKHEDALLSYQDDPGNFIMVIDTAGHDVETAIDVFCIGVEQIAANYPENVEVVDDSE